VLVATADGARDVLPAGLRERGAHVDVVHLYRTVPEPVDADAVRSADLITFTSSSTVASLAAVLGDGALNGLRAASIGPVTSAALREHGIEPAAEADPHTVEGLVAAVERLLGRVGA
jgi:uroporphyrinogen III methyltransferase/synthase